MDYFLDDDEDRDVSYSAGLAPALARRVIGQPAAIDRIVPYVQMFEAGLSPDGRPAGVFLLLGPTGTGKTKTVEALAGELHGSEKSLLKIDCAEFQMEHEVAKLIGAPPGYLGHRETHPMISQQKLEATTSADCPLSIVLFDEIEKAAPSLARLLLGVLDKGTLHLGDNTVVNLEHSLIFLTSNLGARRISRQLRPDFGFEVYAEPPVANLRERLERTAMGAVRKHFSPEFVNRLDVVATYEPLSRPALRQILELQIEELRRHLRRRLGALAFGLEVSLQSREFLLREGTNIENGARHLKRAVHRHLIQPLAAGITSGEIRPRETVYVDYRRREGRLAVRQSNDRLFRVSA